ncbi:MAG: CHASE domain-containing protein [Burkholderiales bacterium]|nr:CHASE domain-containing protein [Burkholderiales bacterium]
MRISKRFFRSVLTSSVWWLGLTIALVLALLSSRMTEQKAAAEFDHQTNTAEAAIQTRVQAYIDLLRSVRALFHTNDAVSRAQFRTFIQQLNLEQSFPGIRNVNFAPRVLASERKAFVASVRRDTSVDSQGYPDFSINPPGDRPEHHVLTYQEPMEKNVSSFGFDMASIEMVKKSLDVSRDTGELSASGKVIRIVGPNRHPALAMRLPLYRHGMPLNTVEQRRAAYYGSVGAGFDIHKLMADALDKNMQPHMRVRLYDTGLNYEQRSIGTTDPGRLLFDSEHENADVKPQSIRPQPRDKFFKRVPLQVGSRVWEVEFSAIKSGMLSPLEIALPWVVLAICLTAALLLHIIYYSLNSARERAVEIATDMTKDLRASEANLAEAQHMAHLGSWLFSPSSGKMVWSNETYRIFGMGHDIDANIDNFLQCLREDERETIRAGIMDPIQSGEEFSAEHRIVQNGGGQRWVHTIVRLDNSSEDRLLRGTIMDITDRKEAVEAMKRSQELLRELTAHQDRVKEEERKRIAREIHDELGQTLLALRIDIAMLEARTGQTHPKLNQKVRAVLSHIDGTVRTIRNIINNLRPAVLDLGLTAAIEWQVAEFERRSGIDCELIIGTRDFSVDDTRATALFRVLQESLTNVLRHAEATRVMIRLYQESNQLVMKITDNGVGIYPNSRRKANSFGLVGVEERIHALNGKCVISSVPGEGTTLTIYIPMARTNRTLIA